MRILLLKPVISCSPNARITLQIKDYIMAIILECDSRAKKRANSILWQHIGRLNCHSPCKKQE